MKNKHLYRSDSNKVVAGIIGGFSDYFDVDATLLRLIFVVFVIFTGFIPGVLAYLVAIFIIPKTSEQSTQKMYGENTR